MEEEKFTYNPFSKVQDIAKKKVKEDIKLYYSSTQKKDIRTKFDFYFSANQVLDSDELKKELTEMRHNVIYQTDVFLLFKRILKQIIPELTDKDLQLNLLKELKKFDKLDIFFLMEQVSIGKKYPYSKAIREDKLIRYYKEIGCYEEICDFTDRMVEGTKPIAEKVTVSQKMIADSEEREDEESF